MAEKFSDFLNKIQKKASIDEAEKKSLNWLLEQAKKLRTATTAVVSDKKITAESVIKDKTIKVIAPGANKKFIGSMVLFHYMPKHRDTLPYYDLYPLIFPIEVYSGSFLGINMHYLAPVHRAKLMDALYTTISDKSFDDKAQLQITYKLLNSMSKFEYFRPCVKKYLMSHVKSQVKRIEPKDWNSTLMLPLQRFIKADSNKVWSDSLKIIKG